MYFFKTHQEASNCYICESESAAEALNCYLSETNVAICVVKTPRKPPPPNADGVIEFGDWAEFGERSFEEFILALDRDAGGCLSAGLSYFWIKICHPMAKVYGKWDKKEGETCSKAVLLSHFRLSARGRTAV